MATTDGSVCPTHTSAVGTEQLTWHTMRNDANSVIEVTHRPFLARSNVHTPGGDPYRNATDAHVLNLVVNDEILLPVLKAFAQRAR